MVRSGPGGNVSLLQDTRLTRYSCCCCVWWWPWYFRSLPVDILARCLVASIPIGIRVRLLSSFSILAPSFFFRADSKQKQWQPRFRANQAKVQNGKSGNVVCGTIFVVVPENLLPAICRVFCAQLETSLKNNRQPCWEPGEQHFATRRIGHRSTDRLLSAGAEYSW